MNFQINSNYNIKLLLQGWVQIGTVFDLDFSLFDKGRPSHGPDWYIW